MTPTDSLTVREKTSLEHLQKAEELGSTLTEYCSAFGVERKALYAMKQQLVKKGVLSGRTRETTEKPAALSFRCASCPLRPDRPRQRVGSCTPPDDGPQKSLPQIM